MAWIDQLASANWSQAAQYALGAYILGCFTTGYYLVRMLHREDIRAFGSGNLGAKNVGRILGWKGFTLTLLGDCGKGAFAVWTAQHFTKDAGPVAVALLAVVAGHVWPMQLRFHGGKGIATSLGGLLVYDYHLAGAFLLLFGAGFVLMRGMVLPGLFAFACLPWVSFYFGDEPPKVAAISVLAGLIFITHRRNLMEEILQFMERHNLRPKTNHREL